MLYYVRIQVSEEIDVNMTNGSKECDSCLYWYFLNKGLKFQPNVWNRCHSFLMMFMDFSNIVILNIKAADYPCPIGRFRNIEAIKLMQNIDLNEWKKILWYRIYKIR